MRDNSLDLRIQTLPELPGVYLMKNSAGQIIYIGKAKRLKRRVASYFSKKHDSAKTQALVKQIAEIDYIVAGTESEALLIEANLIKEHQPRYNIQLRDSKRYPWLAISLSEDFPRMYKTRTQAGPGFRCFGPWPSSQVIKNTISVLHRLFKFRYCRKPLVEGKLIPPVCFYYHIRRCPGPCEGHISKEAYRATIKQAILFLEGKQGDLIRELEREMRARAQALEYEKAAQIRDQLAAIKEASSSQAVHRLVHEDLDIVSLVEARQMAACALLEIRGGRLLAQHIYLEEEADQKPELFTQFVSAHLRSRPGARKKLKLLSDHQELEPEDCQLLGYELIKKPDEGLKKLLRQARFNAGLALEELISRRLFNEGLNGLQRLIGLDRIPRVIEAFDVAHTAGKSIVAACVRFRDGKPDKKNYRKFSIKSVQGQDDYASLAEAVARRYQRLLNEKARLPDLVLIDGGRGQLNAALDVLRALGLDQVKALALAEKEELIYLPEKTEPLALDRHNFSLRLLQSIRDEVHRYVNSFHARKREQGLVQSDLERIKGIGPVLRKKLLTSFGSSENLKAASLEELEKVIGKSKAQALFAALRDEPDQAPPESSS